MSTSLPPIKTPVRIAILDDHPLIRSAFEFSLMQVNGVVLVNACGTRRELLDVLSREPVDVLVLDYLLGDKDVDGLVMIKHLVKSFPETRVLISSSVESPAIVHVAMRSGVRGFIGKSKNFDEIISAIRQVAAGGIYLSPDMLYAIDMLRERDREMQELIELPESGEDLSLKLQDLTPKEIEVVRCYLDGMSNSQIAEKFCRSPKTISGQKKGALRKLGLRNDAELFRFREFFTR